MRRAIGKKPVNSTGRFLQPVASDSSGWGYISMEWPCEWEDLMLADLAFHVGFATTFPFPDGLSTLCLLLVHFCPLWPFSHPLLRVLLPGPHPSCCLPWSLLSLEMEIRRRGDYQDPELSWLCLVWCLCPLISASLPKLSATSDP